MMIVIVFEEHEATRGHAQLHYTISDMQET